MENITLYVNKGTREYDYMWFELGMDEINRNNESPTQCYHGGKCWEYFGTNNGYHKFYHKCHPMMGNPFTNPNFKEELKPTSIFIPVSDLFNITDWNEPDEPEMRVNNLIPSDKDLPW